MSDVLIINFGKCATEYLPAIFIYLALFWYVYVPAYFELSMQLKFCYKFISLFAIYAFLDASVFTFDQFMDQQYSICEK